MANKKNFGAVVIFAGGLFSKIIGFAREIIFANWFGVGDVATAFRIAQSGFLLPTHSLIGETLSSGLLPLYKKYSDRNRIFPIVLRYLAIVYAVALSFVISISLYLFAEFWVKHIAPGVSAGPLNLAADFLKIMSLAVPFYVVGGLFSYIEAAHGKYSGISLRPVLMNVGAIAGAACAVYFNVDMYVALGFSVGHVFIFLWGFFRIQGIVKRDDHSLRFKLLWFPIAKQFFKTIAPLMFVPFVMQLNMLIERIVSSRYGAAVIPSVDYARVVSDTFIQLVSVPLGVVTMSMFSGKDSVELKTYACNVFVVLLAAFIPLSLWSAQFASEIVNLIFVRGAFDSVAANLTSTLLFWFSLGMSFGGAGYYLMKVLNTQLKNRIVMIVVLAGCIVNVAVNLYLGPVFGFAVVGVGYLFNSLIVCFLCIYFLGYFKQIFFYLLLIACIGGVQASLHWTMKIYLEPTVAFIFSFALLFFTYVAMSIFVHPLNNIVTLIFDKILKKVK